MKASTTDCAACGAEDRTALVWCYYDGTSLAPLCRRCWHEWITPPKCEPVRVKTKGGHKPWKPGEQQ